jgi:DNA-binding NtrC family response regulator
MKGIVLRTPALTERREDIPLLAAVFLRRAAGKKRVRLAPKAAAWLTERNWAGNVRELRSLMDCAVALVQPGSGGDIEVTTESLAFAEASAAPADPGRRRTLDETIATLEVQMITAALAEANNNRSEAARLLGISRVGLLKKLDRLGLR